MSWIVTVSVLGFLGFLGFWVALWKLLTYIEEKTNNEIDEQIKAKMEREIGADEYALVRGWCEDSETIRTTVSKIRDKQGYISKFDLIIIKGLMKSTTKEHMRQLVWDEIDQGNT